MGRFTSFSKQIVVFFLVSALIINPTFAVTVGGWTLTNPVAKGASTVYTGVKNLVINGKDYIKTGTVKITPTATQVAKTLARGVAGYALSVAVEQLLGAVDWVLDPANNQIKYKELTCPDGSQDCDSNLLYQARYLTTQTDWHYTKQAACTFTASIMPLPVGYTLKFDSFYGSNACLFQAYNDKGVKASQSIVSLISKPNDKPGEEEEKTLPLDVVAQKVISNAESGDATAQSATTAAAADVVAEAEQDSTKAPPITRPLEASAETKPADGTAADKAGEATGTTKPNAETGATDLALEFPIFCDWAPTVCEAAQIVISFPVTLVEWWNTANSKAEEWSQSISQSWSKVKEEYANKPEENTDTQLDLPDQSDPNINTDLSFGGSCPAPRSVPVSFAGIHTEIEFSFQWFCEVASIAKPVVISISAFAAALIVAGVRTEDD